MNCTDNLPLPVGYAEVAAASATLQGKRVGVIINGGNVDVRNLAALGLLP